MIVLDTNVISEPLKPRPDPHVLAWLNAQPTESLFLTATTLSELLVEIEILPTGKRKSSMMTTVQQALDRLFANRFLSFDREAAIASSLVARRAMAKGFSISLADCQIAAIASVHGFTVASRDTAPFLAAGVPVINPWKP